MSDTPTPEFGSAFGYSFLINDLRRRSEHGFWYEGCFCSWCEKQVPRNKDHGPQDSDVRSD